MIFALQGLVSLNAGKWEEAVEQASKGQKVTIEVILLLILILICFLLFKKVIEHWRKSGSSDDLMLEMGDLLTVKGKVRVVVFVFIFFSVLLPLSVFILLGKKKEKTLEEIEWLLCCE